MSTAANTMDQALVDARSDGIWANALKRLLRKPVAKICLIIVSLYMLMIAASFFGLIASGWQKEAGVADANPTFMGANTQGDGIKIEADTDTVQLDISKVDPLAPRYAEIEAAAKLVKQDNLVRATTLPLGGDRIGRDVLQKAIKGSQVSVLVGLTAALLATTIGAILGAVAGFFGGKIGDLLEWVYNVFTSIPNILLIFAFAAVFGRGVTTVVIILGLTGWTGVYRLIRAEYIKHRSREYVRAAQAIGVSNAAQMFKHILPNVSHVVLVQLSILMVAFIKSEVILSYLGLGVPLDSVSWGTMLAETQNELLRGKWWQLVTATGFMAIFVTAFSLLSDAMRDALDPKLLDSKAE